MTCTYNRATMKTTQRLLTLLAGVLLPALASAADLADLIEHGQRHEALAAINAGSDVNALQPDGSSPLLWAVHGVDHEMVQELLKHGAKPNLANTLGATPLTEAIDLADVDMATMLLRAGADPNQGNHDDETPLLLAARLGSLPLVEELVKAGATGQHA